MCGVADGVDQWLDQCGRTLGEAQRCAERLSRAGRGAEAVVLGDRIAQLRELLERARRERMTFQSLEELDPEWTSLPF